MPAPFSAPQRFGVRTRGQNLGRPGAHFISPRPAVHPSVGYRAPEAPVIVWAATTLLLRVSSMDTRHPTFHVCSGGTIPGAHSEDLVSGRHLHDDDGDVVVAATLVRQV